MYAFTQRQAILASWIIVFTALYLLVALPLFHERLPLSKTLVLLTFIVGLLPVIGNLISNTIIVGISLSVS